MGSPSSLGCPFQGCFEAYLLTGSPATALLREDYCGLAVCPGSFGGGATTDFAVGCSRSAPRQDTWAVLLHLKVVVQPSAQCQEALTHFDKMTKMTNRKGIQVLPLYYASFIVSTASQHTEDKKHKMMELW